jgi:TRAP transporter TAXI family solute receptor
MFGLRFVTSAPRFLLPLIALAASICTISCGTTDASMPAQRLTFLTGPSTGAYFHLGKALADIYNAKIPEAHVTAQGADGPGGAGANAEAIESGHADVAFSRSDLAYLAFRSGSTRDDQPHGHLRAIAVLYTNAVHVVVRRDSGIRRWADVRGKRVQLGDESAGNGGTLTRMILEGEDLSLDDVQMVPNPRNAVARLKSGELDVRIFASAYPLGTIDGVGSANGLDLLPIDPEAVDRLRTRFPFFKPAVIPKRTYPGQEIDYQTVGIDGLLLCRDTVPESLVYQMTRSLFEALPDLMRDQPAARLINVGRAPATPVPLHPGAARYYRERDLFR